MATTPTITETVQSEVAALAHRHLTLTYGLIATVVLLLALMGVGGYLGLKAFDAQLARQEQRDAQYQQDRKTFLDSMQVHDAERTADAVRIAELEAQIKARDSKPLPKPVQDALKPNASANTVAEGLTVAYKSLPSFGVVAVIPPETIALSVPQGQQVLQNKADLDRAQGDLKDTQAVVDLQKQANSSLTKDLGACVDLNTKAQADIAGYKKLAKRSKFKKFLAGAEKVLIFAGGAYLGHRL